MDERLIKALQEIELHTRGLGTGERKAYLLVTVQRVREIARKALSESHTDSMLDEVTDARCKKTGVIPVNLPMHTCGDRTSPPPMRGQPCICAQLASDSAESIDEIERLQRQVTALTQQAEADRAAAADIGREAERLRSENQRLRLRCDALARLQYGSMPHTPDRPSGSGGSGG